MAVTLGPRKSLSRTNYASKSFIAESELKFDWAIEMLRERKVTPGIRISQKSDLTTILGGRNNHSHFGAKPDNVQHSGLPQRRQVCHFTCTLLLAVQPGMTQTLALLTHIKETNHGEYRT